MRVRSLIVSWLVLLVAVSAGYGQVATGTPPFASIGGGPFDAINLGNLNVQFSIPVVNKAGRGMPFTYALSYDSSVWSPSTGSWQPVGNWGWRGKTEAMTGYVSYLSRQDQCVDMRGDTIPYALYDNWTYHDAFGVPHPLPDTLVVTDSSGQRCDPPPAPRSASATTQDGSGYRVDVTWNSAMVYPRSGGSIYPPLQDPSNGGTFTDSNGNQLSSNGSAFTDTLGTTALSVSGSAPNPVVFTYTNPSGGSSTVTLNYASYTVQTNFPCGSVRQYGPTTVSLVNQIVLADGTHYDFTYEPTPGYSGSVTGRIASVTLPTGGTISYAYSGGSNGITCSDGSAAELTRTTPDATWTYTRTGADPSWTTTILHPKQNTADPQNRTVLNFQKPTYDRNLYETQRKVYQGDTLLKTVSTCYNDVCSGSFSLPISKRSVKLQLPDSSGRISQTDTFYNPYGLVAETDEYDFGSGSPGGLLRKTTVSYASLSNGIVDRASQVTVYDDGNNIRAQSTYAYDQYALTPTSGIPQHVAVSGSRGNLTTANRWVSGTNWLTEHFTYFDTGLMQTATAVNDAQTTFTYGDCGNSFFTYVALPLDLHRSAHWDCNGGILLWTKDENDQKTSYTYDDLWRVSSVTDPANNSTNTTYPNATRIESVLVVDGTQSSVDVITNLDGLGRRYVTQRRQTPGGTTFDSVQTDYDVVGRPRRMSVPYSAALGGTTTGGPWTTTTYDALDRPIQVADGGNGTLTYMYVGNNVYEEVGPAPTGENAKRKQLEYDALGRLKSVCEITSGTGSGLCDQPANPTTGYWTKYTYDVLDNLTGVTQNAQAAAGSQQNRSYVYDSLGRLTQETNPETTNTTTPGAINYTYDSDATCGKYRGDLVKRVDNANNVTCYAYDALHRVTAITYPGNSGTPEKYFVYDGATVNSVIMANAKGRLAEAYTGPTDGKVTDEGFSYSARGELTDVYQSTPNSGGYYHVSSTYWPHGVVKQLSGLGLPTLTYGVDGEGRPSSVSASSGQNPVTGTTYNVASQPTGVTFGSEDSDSFSYDPNTNRMTQYRYNVAPAVPHTVDVRFTNDSCSGCGGGTPVGGGDRNLFVNSIIVGSTTIQPNDPSVSYTSTPCNGYYNGVGTLACSGDMISTDPTSAPGQAITVNAYGSPDYNIYPHMQLLVNGAIVGEWDVSGVAQNYTVNATPVVGTLAWNPNGWLASLAISDPFNAANNQTCTYGHDDLGRIQSANCGSAWNQTFSFDPFGNIKKSGSISFLPNYDTATNHMSGLQNLSYDANGNLTNDSFHAYTWDIDGNNTGVDPTTSLTYDALGRMVEQNGSNAYTQIVYAPSGQKLALMNGQTVQKAFVPLPGGGAAVYSGSTLSYYRHTDWLGSSRFASTPGQGMYSDTAYAPYGEPYAEAGMQDRSFTGQNQDTAVGLYDFLFREYHHIAGRWTSPDPAGLAAVDAANPQSWNRYAYVTNNPTVLIDPLGLQDEGPPQLQCYFLGGWFFGDICELIYNSLRGPQRIGEERPRREPREPKPRKAPTPTFTFGVRTPKQTFSQCMEQNASNYSAAGFVDLTSGANGRISNNVAASIIGGNSITGTYFAFFGNSNQSAFNALTTGGGFAGNIVSRGMGSTITYGRRTAQVMAINLAGRGGLPKALSSASGGVKGFFGKLGTGALKLAADTGFTLAEGLGCLIPQ